MVKRDLSGYKEFQSIYEELFRDLEASFKEKVDRLTPFHHILLDRVCDAYIESLRVENKVESNKGKSAQERLQKWLSMALAELHNVESEAVSRKLFYKNFVDVVKEYVKDTITRQQIFVAIQTVMKRGKLDVE